MPGMGVLMVVVVAMIFVWRSHEAVATAGEGKRGKLYSQRPRDQDVLFGASKILLLQHSAHTFNAALRVWSLSPS